MNCPVCDRSLAPTLSICPACGAMMNDTVREELQTKITSGSLRRTELPPQMPAFSKPYPTPKPVAPPPPVRRQETAELVASKTSQTLVEFQTKSASLPDWRLQLQNAVQQRKGGQNVSAVATATTQSFPTNGGAALKVEVAPVAMPEPETKISDPRVANAMRRINESHKTFSATETAPKRPPIAKPAPARAFPFDVVSSPNRAAAAATQARISSPVVTPPKPRLVVPPPAPVSASAPVVEKRDTNKLPPLAETIERVVPVQAPIIPSAVPVASEPVVKAESSPLPPEFAEIKRIRIKAENVEITEPATADYYEDEIDDLAPFSMRFGAGLFDGIITAFAGLLILSPFAFSGASWTTVSGILTFAAAWAIVSFIYMTVCVGFFGKTLGMRLFSLEVVDALENEYPTLHQAAISSSIYLLSMGFAGSGFITAFFNEERRAIHDLLSGTIMVREF